MTAATLQAGKTPALTWIQLSVVMTGTGLLFARPELAATFGWTTATVSVLFGAVLALGLAPPARRDRTLRWAPGAVLGAGVVLFTAGRLLSSGSAPQHATAYVIALNTLAAFAEEALFRRVAYDALLDAGAAWAIAGSAAMFALAHVPVYGWSAFPLDAAAGVLLGWQRWASGTWMVPALTHAFADFVVVI